MPPAKNPRLVRIGPLLLDVDVLAEMQQLAADHDRSLNAEMRQACRHYVRAHRQRQNGGQAAQQHPQRPQPA